MVYLGCSDGKKSTHQLLWSTSLIDFKEINLNRSFYCTYFGLAISFNHFTLTQVFQKGLKDRLSRFSASSKIPELLLALSPSILVPGLIWSPFFFCFNQGWSLQHWFCSFLAFESLCFRVKFECLRAF